jgi:hypothetical protein
MTYGEIEEVFKEYHYTTTIVQLREAVGVEATALQEGLNAHLGEEASIEQAREFFAEDISRWLAEGGNLCADSLLAKRLRYSQSWAFAAIIDGLQRKEIEDIAMPEVDPDTLTRICLANAELGSKLVEVMNNPPGHAEVLQDITDIVRALDAADAPKFAALTERGLAPVERLEALLENVMEARSHNQPSVACDECPVHELDTKKLSCHMVWIAMTVHNGHHVDVEPVVPDWRQCTMGICGSMEQMLGEVGLDKDLKERVRIP